jgi:hypothetical protein
MKGCPFNSLQNAASAAVVVIVVIGC